MKRLMQRLTQRPTWTMIAAGLAWIWMLSAPSAAMAQNSGALTGLWIDEWNVMFNLTSASDPIEGYAIDGTANYSSLGWWAPVPVSGYSWVSDGVTYFQLVAMLGESPTYYGGAVRDWNGNGACPACAADVVWWYPFVDDSESVATVWNKLLTGMTIAPAAVGRGECFTASFGISAANQAVYVLYRRYEDPYQMSLLFLDGDGNAVLCTDSETLVGQYSFFAVRIGSLPFWIGIDASVFVFPGQQPEALDISPTVVQQGECFTVEVHNGAQMTLDVIFRVNGGAPFLYPSWTTLDPNGRGYICTDPYWWGTLTFVSVRNSANNDWDIWTPVNIDVSIGVRQPSGLTITPSVLRQGECFVVTVPNGVSMTLDVAYRLDYGELQHIDSWPALDINGQAYICTDAFTWIGVTTWAYIRNTFSPGNTGWVETNADVWVYPQAPVITVINPAGASQGDQVSVTLTGWNLDGAVLTTNFPGLDISDVTASSNTVTATFVISSSASPGSAAIAVTTTGGTATVQFAVAGISLSREYIYFGGRVLAIERP